MIGPGLPAPADLLPHRAPFLFVDVLDELTAGVNAVGRWKIDPDLEVLRGHFPGRPTLPGVLMVEALAQVGACAVLADDRFTGRLPLFGGVDAVRFRRQVLPGEELRLEVEMSRLSARGGKGHGRASVAGTTACEADLLFVLA